MKLTSFAYSSCGGRDKNEDAIRSLQRDGHSVFVLADGLGGHQYGEVASRIAADTVLEAFPQPTQEALHAAAERANYAILEAQTQSGLHNMNTTLVCLSIEAAKAAWLHIGDSRLYHFSGGAVQTVTHDHSVSFKKYLGREISYLDLNHDSDRSSLLRVLGIKSFQPEVHEVKLLPGDALLLCSDGFWEYVYDQEMVIDWIKSETPHQWVTYMLLRLMERIPPHNDNCSVIAVFVGEEP